MPDPTVSVPLSRVNVEGDHLKIEVSVSSDALEKRLASLESTIESQESGWAMQGAQLLATTGGSAQTLNYLSKTSWGQKALAPALKIARVGVVAGGLAPSAVLNPIGLGAAAFAAGGVVGHYGGKYLGDKIGGWAADLMGYGDVKLKPFTPKKGAVADQIVKQEVAAIKQQATATKELTQEKLHQQEVVEALASAQEGQLDGTRLLEEAQSSLFDAAIEGLKVYGDNAADVSGKMRNLFTDTFQSIEDRLTQFVLKGRLSFSGLAESIKESLAQMAVGNLIMSPMRELV